MPDERAPTKATKRTRKTKARAPTGDVDFKASLWNSSDVLRNNVDPAEYKHVVLGLLFLKYIEDAFNERQADLTAAVAEPKSEYYLEDEAGRPDEIAALLEERDEYTRANIFWVPAVARWSNIRANIKRPQIKVTERNGETRTVNPGGLIDHAMDAIEHENPTLKGVLPKIYARPNVDQHRLGKLVDLFSDIGLGTAEHRASDTLGKVYQYFLSKFASAEGKGGGEFYTPESIVRLLVDMIEPFSGRVYDPCCGSGGMFVQSLKFITAHDGKKDQASIYGQESNYTTWRLARMNMAIRGIEANLGHRHADTFRDDLHPDLKADYILANPPFNIKDWYRQEGDARWRYGTPPKRNANFAWVQHFIHHLAPGGTAGFVLANGAMSSMQSGEGDIRQSIVDADLVDCIVACPGQLFTSTQIPVCLWFITRNKAGNGHRNRKGETLFIDARQLGKMESRVVRVFEPGDIARIADTYHGWRNAGGTYADVAGFCKSATTAEIAAHEYVLTPGRYVGAVAVEDDGEPFDVKMKRLTKDLKAQMADAADLDAQIREALEGLGYGV